MIGTMEQPHLQTLLYSNQQMSCEIKSPITEIRSRLIRKRSGGDLPINDKYRMIQPKTIKMPRE
ncbi:hypothetical protein HNO89_004051 [Sporosarcina luteola]|nr:hypothetical protein [Sporosarcina luteola]